MKMSKTLQEKKEYRYIPLIYIAGKLNAEAVDYLLNVSSLMSLAEQVRKLGYGYYCPAIDLIMGIKFDYKSYHDYFDNGQVALVHCDAIIVNDNWKTSKGTKAEIELAEKLGMPIFYSIEELRNSGFIDEYEKEMRGYFGKKKECVCQD